MGAGMTGPTGLFGVEPQADQMTFVPEESPDFSSYGRVVAIIAPSASHSPSSTGGCQSSNKMDGPLVGCVHPRLLRSVTNGRPSLLPARGKQPPRPEVLFSRPR